MKSNRFLRISPIVPALLVSQSALAGDVINDGAVVAGSPTVTTQVQIADDKTLEVQSGASIENGTAHAVIDAVDGTTFTVINDGTISTTRDLYDAINTQNSKLNLTNTGTIHGMEDAIDTGSAGLIQNSGTILGDDEGIIVNGHMEKLINSGTITGVQDDGVQARSIDYLYNSGSIVSENDDGILTLDAQGIGTLINSGTIKADDEAINTDALDYLKNTGTITSDREAVYVDGDVKTFINEGTIDSKYSSGLYAGSLESFINRGTISGGDEGVWIDDGRGSGAIGTFYNFGMINSDGNGVDALSAELLNNSGTINAEASAIELGSGTIINSGTLTGSREATVEFGGSGTANLINSGIIENSAGPTGAAIEFQTGGTGYLTLNPGSVIIGTIDLANASDTLTVGNGLSIANTFIGMPEEINANGAAYAVNGNQVAVADVSGFKAFDNALVDLTSTLSHNIGQRFTQTFETVASESTADIGYWMSAFGAGTRHNGDGNIVDHRHGYGGVVMGADGSLANLARLGAFMGAAVGQINMDYDSQTIDMASIYSGVYGKQDIGNYTVGFAITAGYNKNDSKRSVANNTQETGLETASATYGSWFISPELSIKSEFSIFGQKILPTLTTRYLGAYVSDYSESGSDGSMSVDSRQIHELLAKAEIAIPAYQTAKFNLIATLGLEGRLSRGDKNLSSTMLNQTSNFDITSDRESFQAYAGIDMNGKLAQNKSWFFKTEIGSGSNIQFRGESQAGLRLTF